MQSTETMQGRVASSTDDDVNAQIKRDTEDSVRVYARHPERIDERLRALAKEWDIERILEANASTLALAGTLLGAFVDRRWLLLPAAVTTFLLQHALQGWCPPLPLFRRLGIRTKAEILRERYALRALRGDLDPVCERHDDAPDARARAVLRAVSA